MKWYLSRISLISKIILYLGTLSCFSNVASKITVYTSKWNDDWRNINKISIFLRLIHTEKKFRVFQMVYLGRKEKEIRASERLWHVTGFLPWLPVSVQCDSLHLHSWLLLPTAALKGGCGCGNQCVTFAFTPFTGRLSGSCYVQSNTGCDRLS